VVNRSNEASGPDLEKAGGKIPKSKSQIPIKSQGPDPKHGEPARFGLGIGICLEGSFDLGVSSALAIDTGCNFDGVLTPKLFQLWTNRWEGHSGEITLHASFPNGRFGGATYTNLDLHGNGDVNMVGLSFLARHLVTTFPNEPCISSA